MAEGFSDEGLDAIVNYLPRNTGSALPSTLYMAAITTAGWVTRSPDTALTATTVPGRTTVWATDYQTVAASSTRGAGGEPTIGTGAYARVSMANTIWAAPTNQAGGRRTTGSQQQFAQSSAAWSNATVVGYAVVTASGAGSGIAYYYANFDDGTSVAVNAAGIVLQVQPYWEFDV